MTHATTAADESPKLCDEGRELIRDILERIGDKWSVIVICQLDDATRGFNELRRSIGPVTQRMLSATLRRLERDGLVKRTVHDTKPPRVDYALTRRGLSLLVVVRQLARWAQDNATGIVDARRAFDVR